MARNDVVESPQSFARTEYKPATRIRIRRCRPATAGPRIPPKSTLTEASTDYASAATTIQRAVRNRHASERKRRKFAATRIQRVTRGNHQRRKNASRTRAAESIQRIYRGSSSRKRSRKQRVNKEQCNAATKIQKARSWKYCEESFVCTQQGVRKSESIDADDMAAFNAAMKTAIALSSPTSKRDTLTTLNDALRSAVSPQRATVSDSQVKDIMEGFEDSNSKSESMQSPPPESSLIFEDSAAASLPAQSQLPLTPAESSLVFEEDNKSMSSPKPTPAASESSLVFASNSSEDQKSPSRRPPETPSKPMASLEDMSGMLRELGDVDDIMGDMIMSPFGGSGNNMFISTESLPDGFKSPKGNEAVTPSTPKQAHQEDKDPEASILYRRRSERLIVNTQTSFEEPPISGSMPQTPAKGSITPQSIPPTPKGMLASTPKHLPAQSPSARELWKVLSLRGVSLGNVSDEWEMMLDPESNKTWYRNRKVNSQCRWDPPPEGSPVIVRQMSNNFGIMPMPSINEGQVFDELSSPKKMGSIGSMQLSESPLNQGERLCLLSLLLEGTCWTFGTTITIAQRKVMTQEARMVATSLKY